MPYIIHPQDVSVIYQEIAALIKQARSNVLRSVNHQQVVAYWHIGRVIVEREQQGQNRAEYGKQLIMLLSKKLSAAFGKGFSPATLRRIRQFYLTYSDMICAEPGRKFDFCKNLSWTHYKILMKESRKEARKFYEIEAAKNNWSTPELQRQIDSCLFDRLAASQDAEKVLSLAEQGQIIIKPEDMLKEPVVLDFLGYKQDKSYTETEVESAIITHLQDFLLEMGEGVRHEVASKSCFRSTGNHPCHWVNLGV